MQRVPLPGRHFRLGRATTRSIPGAA